MYEANARPHPQDPLDPAPTPGCGVCEALAETRRLAWAVGNLSAVTVQNAELANHPHTSGATR
ncbi:hypothetical protein ABZW32_31995 [Streptomyces sp. NPDC004667]|uniref:hypothetical protein n=1 Tax=Streptomyces sp. NPDC004667 TaxID=3154285 RepID=UPI0033B08E8B